MIQPTDPSKLSDDILDSFKDASFHSHIHDNLQGINSLIEDSEFLKVLPIASGVYRAYKASKNIQNKLYFRKITKFMVEAHKISEDERNKFAERLSSNREEATKVGIATTEILDSFSKSEKAVYLAKVFRAYILEASITLEVYIRLSEIIDAAYVSDLDYLAGRNERPNHSHFMSIGVEVQPSMENIFKTVSKQMDRNSEFAHMGLTSTNDLLGYNRTYTDDGILLSRIFKQYT